MSRLVPQYESTQIILAISEIWQHAIWNHVPRKSWNLVPKPTFALNDDMHAWGRWIGGADRLMEIKTALVLEHPWYAVIDVVLHETAHQLVELFAPDCGEPPHGERFKWFCRLLGANATASGDYPPLDVQVFVDDVKEQESPIALRIRKLLALSNSPNENEAKMAMMKARELMAKHDMGDIEHPNFVKNSNDFVSITLGKPLKHITLDYSYLANILKDFYNVLTIWISAPTSFNPLTWGRTLEVSGTPLDVRIASYAFDFLENYVDMAWENQPTAVRRSGGMRRRRDFAIGVYSAFYEVLEAQNRRPEMQALVHVEHPELDSYYNKRYPHVRHSSSSIKIDKKAREAGAELGRNLSIPKGLENEGKGRKMLH
ncbi:MAG: DUF2786 domain-containing protein [Lentisphaeria bacterium]|nr:DUF2786 domain-containing protein [Lentisphaeria bacterium]